MKHITYTQLQIEIYAALHATDPEKAEAHRQAMVRAYPEAHIDWSRV